MSQLSADIQNFLDNEACVRCRDTTPFNSQSEDCQSTFFSPSLNSDISCAKGLEINASLVGEEATTLSREGEALESATKGIVTNNAEENKRRLEALTGIKVD